MCCDDVVGCHVVGFEVRWDEVRWCDVMLCHVMWYDLIRWDGTEWNVTGCGCDAMWLCDMVGCEVMWCDEDVLVWCRESWGDVLSRYCHENTASATKNYIPTSQILHFPRKVTLQLRLVFLPLLFLLLILSATSPFCYCSFMLLSHSPDLWKVRNSKVFQLNWQTRYQDPQLITSFILLIIHR